MYLRSYFELLLPVAAMLSRFRKWEVVSMSVLGVIEKKFS
jgi:hypothetical protein